MTSIMHAIRAGLLAGLLAVALLACDAINSGTASDAELAAVRAVVDQQQEQIAQQSADITILRERLAALEESTASASQQIGTSIEGLRDLGAFFLVEYQTLEPGEPITADGLTEEQVQMLRDWLGR